jgi:hypothetical protein
MGNVVPNHKGTDIENVIYSYRIDKETGSLVVVNVYNKNADGTDYIFRETDEWKPGSLAGTQINKIVPLGRIHKDQFGDGGIDVNGPGSVYDANVVYTYRINPCYDPQFDPNCPGYEVPYVEPVIVDYEVYDAVGEGDAEQDEYVLAEDEFIDDELTDEERAKLEEDLEEDSKDRLEKALFEVGRNEFFNQAFSQSQLVNSANINLNSYTAMNIQGGTYEETIVLSDTQLPDAPRGLRNGLAQDQLHTDLVRSQYK